MAVLTRPSKPKTSRPSDQFATPEATLPRPHRDPEAPDRGAAPAEARESGRVRYAEAPDAGEGRAALFAHDFTHGRSQS